MEMTPSVAGFIFTSVFFKEKSDSQILPLLFLKLSVLVQQLLSSSTFPDFIVEGTCEF